MNALTSLVNTFSETTTWEFDALGRPTVLTLANGAATTYTFDATGRASRVANVKSGGTIISSFDYSFDAAGNPTTLAEANGDLAREGLQVNHFWGQAAQDVVMATAAG